MIRKSRTAVSPHVMAVLVGVSVICCGLLLGTGVKAEAARLQEEACMSVTDILGQDTFSRARNFPNSNVVEEKATLYFADSTQMECEGEIGVAYVKKALNVREKASKSSQIVGRLYRGAGAEIIDVEGDWIKISSGEVEGWVSASYLVMEEEAEAFVETISPCVVTVEEETVSVYSSQSTDADVVVEVSVGDAFAVISQEEDWIEIRLTTKATGYIQAEEVSVEEGLFVGVTLSEEKSLQKEIDQMALNGWVSLGTFKVTAYCSCARCCGTAGNKTASGATPTAGYTIAVDKRVISLGSMVKIAGLDGVYCAQDTGVKGNTIDLYFSSHSAAKAWGVRYLEVWVQE